MTGNEEATETPTGKLALGDLETQPIYYVQHEHGEGVAYLVADLYREAVSGHSYPRKKAVVDSIWNEEAEIDTF